LISKTIITMIQIFSGTGKRHWQGSQNTFKQKKQALLSKRRGWRTLMLWYSHYMLIAEKK